MRAIARLLSKWIIAHNTSYRASRISEGVVLLPSETIYGTFVLAEDLLKAKQPHRPVRSALSMGNGTKGLSRPKEERMRMLFGNGSTESESLVEDPTLVEPSTTGAATISTSPEQEVPADAVLAPIMSAEKDDDGSPLACEATTEDGDANEAPCGNEKNYNDSFVNIMNLTNSIQADFTELKGALESMLSDGAADCAPDEPTEELVAMAPEKDDDGSSVNVSALEPHSKAASGELVHGGETTHDGEQTGDSSPFAVDSEDSTEFEELKDAPLPGIESPRSSVCSSRKRRESSAEFSIANARSSLLRRSSIVLDRTLHLAATTVTDPKLLGALSCSAIVVNYISAGYILLPYAFYQAGLIYGSILFAAVALQSYITSLFILETCARAESGNWISSRHGGLPQAYSMAIRNNQYELTSLQHKFLGKKWTKFFLGTMACDLYSITWVVTAVFGKALAAALPMNGIRDDYKMWVGVFMVITVPLSCTNIVDQVLLQFIFLGGRLVMVVLMIGTVVAALGSGGEHFDVDMDTVEHAPLINLNHTITIIQTAIFATAFQFSVPSMAGISSNKKSMTSIFQRAVSFVYASNCLLAVLMAAYFGSATNPSSNLNWEGYHAGTKGWSNFVSGYVVLFAALDGLAVFPLMCSTLGGILFSGLFGEETHLTEQSLKVQILFRVIASLPQCLGALYVDDLGVLATFGGIFTLLSYSAAPSMLYIASGKSMQESGLPERTSYSSKFFSHHWVAYGLLVLTALVLVGVVVDASMRKS